jgi:hypothetical protein
MVMGMREKLIEVMKDTRANAAWHRWGYEESADHLIANDVVPVVRKPVRGYEEQYVVDQFGRVYGVYRTTTVQDNGRIYEKPIAGKQMKQSMHPKGYKTVTLTKDGKTKTVYVHRIVAEAFIDNPNNLPMVNHKDEDKTNNFVENLEWCSASYNRTYGKGTEKQARKLRGRKHTEEHKQKISNSLKKHYAEKDDFCSYGERKDNE